MTTTTPVSAELPEALQLAADLSSIFISEEVHATKARKIAAELRRLHQSEREGWRHADELKQDLDRLHAQVEALSTAQAGVQAGYVLVPAGDATDAMLAAFAKAASAEIDWHGATENERQEVRDGFGPAYRAMLAEAPQPIPSPVPSHLGNRQDLTPSAHAAWIAFERIASNQGPDVDAADKEGFALIRDYLMQAARVGCYRTTSPAPAQPGQGVDRSYLPLPECDAATVGLGEVWNRHSMRAYVDADRAARAAPQPATADEVDAERLDWLDTDGSECVFHIGFTWYTRASYGQPYRKHANLRNAIDAAMAAKREPKP